MTTVTKPSTKKLSEVARHLVYPQGIVSSGWPRIRSRLADMAISFDGWQQGAAQIILGRDESGRYVATVGGVTMSIPRQVGKALDVNTPMLTANRGWTTMGDLRVGDSVFGADGKPTRVIGAHAVRLDRECFLVRTTDGREVVADAEHLWTVVDRRAEVSRGPISARTRWHEERTLTTKQLLEAGLRRSVRANGRNEWRFQLPRQGAVLGQDAGLPIDPYVFGAWLGDGTSVNGTFAVHRDDMPHLAAQIQAGGYEVVAREGRTCWMLRASALAEGRRQLDSLAGRLRAMGVLGNKHIPDEYLAASATQRESLLQGLMDTDGSISSSGKCEFSSSRKSLAEDVLFLIRSLGWRGALKESDAKISGRVVGKRWRVTFMPKAQDPFTPFRLPRKVSRIASTPDTHGRHTVSICSIEPVESRPVRCITVDAPDALYLAGRDLVVTHNTFTIGSLLVAMCVEYPGLRVVWTSHHLRTTTNTFRSMQGMVRRKRIAPHLAHNGIRTANGEQEIRFSNGSIIMFGAREHGFGVGIDAIDVLVCDEAQRLSSRALADMVPTTNQSRHEHGALLFFIGTPPRPDNDGDEFAARRRKALAGKMLNGIYVEMAADKGSDPDDESQWRKANPSFPHRTPYEAMLRLRENLTDEGDWLREAMGIWDDDDNVSVFGVGKWADCAGDIPADRVAGAVGVAVSVDLSTAAVVLGARSDGRVIPLPSGHGPGTDWVINRAVSVAAEQRVPIVIDGGGPGAFLVDDMRKAARKRGIRVIVATLANMKDACAAIFLQVGSGELLHGGWPELDAAVAGAVQRQVGDRWLWGRRGQKRATKPPDISLLEAATVALWGQDNVRTRSAADQRLTEGGPAVLSI